MRRYGLLITFAIVAVYAIYMETAHAPLACKRAGGSYTLDGECSRTVLVKVPYK